MTVPDMRQDSPTNHAGGAQVIQTNVLSTPVLMVALLIFSVFGVGVGYAVERSAAADEKAVIAEREARLAQARYAEQAVEVGILKERMRDLTNVRK